MEADLPLHSLLPVVVATNRVTACAEWGQARQSDVEVERHHTLYGMTAVCSIQQCLRLPFLTDLLIPVLLHLWGRYSILLGGGGIVCSIHSAILVVF